MPEVALAPIPGSNKMGRVITTIKLVNHRDQILADQGIISSAEIRSVEIADALVDTGATKLSAPVDIISLLGLPLRRTVSMNTANGKRDARIFGEAELTVCGRTDVFECAELPVGTPVLLGVIPLESLLLEPDLQNQTLKVLPETGPDTQIYAL